ncbi:helix-turn-helix domain-containing protein [Saccharopolyspora phatthalungensis]|uniref:Transcriptional regulator with XRE-family HTH domain n=1 Tax=Saccharopolyspora phatthalungensis TaxID=664693 RepID=A0A840QJ70_9PSEU|nr:helix-turn-helix transcriptional regulator [Saccharopolyspora phatthalungensis]MBB5159098.1 transcriptional regulator with XRE-family HTH domain [Saccharopolyspora phatthalungensis]
MDHEDKALGRRLREVRAWRQLSLKETADLAGISFGYLGRIERGEQPVTSRATLEALANALRIDPGELTGTPYAPCDPVGSDAHAALREVEKALSSLDLGVDPGVQARPWAALAAEVDHLNNTLRAAADYAAQGAVVPGLLTELHAAYVQQPNERQNVLVGLLHTFDSAAVLTKNLGVRGWPVMAARLAENCAQELDRPEWLGFTTWLRGHTAGSHSRTHQYGVSVGGIDALASHLDCSNALQAAGMLHLNAALAAAAQSDADTTRDHLREATELASRLPERHDNFGYLHFSPDNVGIWRVSLGTELGEGAKVAEIARHVRPEAVPAKARRAMFYADLGRALASEKRTREQGIRALIKAESIAPQRIRNNIFVRETVADLLRQARRDAGGRDLRGLAWRMGVVPTG